MPGAAAVVVAEPWAVSGGIRTQRVNNALLAWSERVRRDHIYLRGGRGRGGSVLGGYMAFAFHIHITPTTKCGLPSMRPKHGKCLHRAYMYNVYERAIRLSSGPEQWVVLSPVYERAIRLSSGPEQWVVLSPGSTRQKVIVFYRCYPNH